MSQHDDRQGSPEATTSQGLVTLRAKSTPPETAEAGASAEVEEFSGPNLWRSLDELAGSERFRELLHREFPRFASEWDEGVDRRRFLQLSSAGLALAGLTACTKQPPEEIVAYVRKPEDIIPGKPLYYATAIDHGGYAQPVLAESHMGRPTKVSGNPEHPTGAGANVFITASTRDLYDPDRSQALIEAGRVRSWQAFVDVFAKRVLALRATGGEGLRLLTGPVSSPTLAAQIGRILAAMPEARWVQWQSGIGANTAAAAETAFGAPANVYYDLTPADVVVAIDSDFLNEDPGSLVYAHDFMARRKGETLDEEAMPVLRPGSEMNRLYSIETGPTGTSTVADHRLALTPSGVANFVLALAGRLGVAGVTAPTLEGKAAEHLDAIVEDLEKARGRSVLLAGDHLDVDVQVLVHAINDALGNIGTSVIVTEPVLADAGEQTMTLAELAAELEAGSVDTLLVSGVNPVYEAPADIDFGAALAAVTAPTMTIHHGLYLDETAEQCLWHVPATHDLEAWGDSRSFDGTVSLRQPLIEPLYDGKSALDVLAVLEGRVTTTGRELVREHHQAASGLNGSFSNTWRRQLHDGFVPDSAAAPLAFAGVSGAAEAAAAISGAGDRGTEIVFRPDPTLYDGRYANNGWLQECPKPITMLTWDNALLVSPKMARGILGDGRVKESRQDKQAWKVDVTVGEHTMRVPLWVVPGHADDCATLHLGGGRRRGGETLVGAGFDANQLRTSEAMWRAEKATIVAADEKYLLASTQDHFSMEGRDLVRSAPADDYFHDLEEAGVIDAGGKLDKKVLEKAEKKGKGVADLFDRNAYIDSSKTILKHNDFPYDGYAWGMTVDLSTCTGCNACVVACSAENNIPVVGKDQVARGRELHWIRVDRYFVTNEDAGKKTDDQHAEDEIEAIVTQPVYCMHCEQAPCEIVCPVAATVHSDEGLNDMVYNRCVGTRYCSNNCPYKVRRFNFYLYADFETPSYKLMRNPDVTVRSRGVMEKCSYCVQRINEARHVADVEKRKIRDGEIKTACQNVCPSDCMTFGDINDPLARVTGYKRSPRNYSLLSELGTRPRTTYLARLTNPNPKLAKKPMILGGKGRKKYGGDKHKDADHGAEAGH
ncbi:MAG: TAT-variant-translocated molybdopterin oxidoreductase [Acidobacteriota bacterium]